ncbi:ABC transporter ATP-binding protein [Chitinimonas koreensis]|uniref:ABC transporter ATP-binding protein n=1 Tax=Chitinimonas koreensis TaxID=356302 RepID=UPI000429369C|nr:ABC transporter ATP-binding protein [Chitinimonas koreensis]
MSGHVDPAMGAPERQANADDVIDVAGLTKRYGDKTVVDGLSMRVRRGEIYGFLGPNGSGKTTSIRMMCGLLTPDAGQGHTLGYDVVKEAAAIKREVGYMTQRFGLYDDLSIRENLDFVARVYGMDRRRERVDQALSRLGLEGRQKQLAGSLSGGWKQRLALAACMLHEPRLLLLDEPTAGVDPKARRDFWDEIHHLARQGITVLVSTHYMDEAERCHRLGYIAYGRLLAMGTPAELVRGSALSTWTIAGEGAGELADALEAAPGVEMVTRFGNALHVSGADEARLAAAVAPYRERAGLRFEHGEPALEDVFIHLMRQSADNFPGGGR